MENFQDRGVWIPIRSLKNAWIRIWIRIVLRGWIRIRFVLRGWFRIRSISDRIRNPVSHTNICRIKRPHSFLIFAENAYTKSETFMWKMDAYATKNFRIYDFKYCRIYKNIAKTVAFATKDRPHMRQKNGRICKLFASETMKWLHMRSLSANFRIYARNMSNSRIFSACATAQNPQYADFSIPLSPHLELLSYMLFVSFFRAKA